MMIECEKFDTCSHFGRSDVIETGYALVGRTLREVTYQVANGLAFFEGDIVLGTIEQVHKIQDTVRAYDGDFDELGAILVGGTWPDGRMAYCVHPSVSQDLIDQAAKHIRDRAAILVNSAGSACSLPVGPILISSLYLDRGDCHSFVGFQQSQPQIISIGPGCAFGQVVHETCHALGLFHEQCRPDRDNYVEILWGNILPSQRHNFEINPQASTSGPYDYASIMHYGTHYFSSNGLPTIRPKQSGVTIGQRRGLSLGDINALHRLYRK